MTQPADSSAEEKVEPEPAPVPIQILQVSASEDKMVQAVLGLTQSVDALRGLVSEKYVERQEIAEFITKKDRKRRLWFAALILAFSMVAASFTILAVTSYCFLQGVTRPACTPIPGYSKTMDRLQVNREATSLREVRITVLEEQMQDLLDQMENSPPG